MTHNEDWSIEADPELTQMVEKTDKDISNALINIYYNYSNMVRSYVETWRIFLKDPHGTSGGKNCEV